MQTRTAGQPLILKLRPDAAMIAIPSVDENEDITYFYVDDAGRVESDSMERLRTIHALAGAWNDLDWDNMEEELDLIRHQSVPTPPLEDL